MDSLLTPLARARALSRRRYSWLPILSAIGMTLAALVLYGATRSASLDDFDSYSFALALDRFDIALQQPQPPGFPVYVAAARGVHAVVDGARLALATLSAIGGALSVGAVVMIGWQLFRRLDVALLSAAILAVSPVQWLTASKALSDAPGLAMSLVALAALWAGRSDRRWLLAGAGLLGLSLGVRAQTNLPGVVLAVGLAWEALRVPVAARSAAWRGLAAAAAVGLAALLVWLIPVAQDSGGLRPYLDSIDAHSSHVWQSDSLFGQGPVTSTTLRARAKDALETLLVPTLGISVYQPVKSSDAAQVAALAVFVVGGVLAADYRRGASRWLALWALLIVVPYLLLESLNRPRLLLPALPPVILLAVGGWLRLADRLPRHVRPIRWAVGGLIVIALLLEAAPLAGTLARESAPPAQAAAAVRAAYPPAETLLIAAGSFRAAQVELPEYPIAYLYALDADATAAAVAGGAYRYIAILDRDQVSADLLPLLSDNGRYVPVDDRLFVRDPRVHWQHSQVRLQVLMPADQIDAARLRLPPDGRIELGAPEDGRFVGQGWFRAESVGGAAARWAEGGAGSELRVSLTSGVAYRVTVRAAAYPADQRVTVLAGERALAEFALPADWREVQFTLPAEAIPPGESSVLTLRLVHDAAESPYERTNGDSSDRRALAAAYAWIAFAPAE